MSRGTRFQKSPHEIKKAARLYEVYLTKVRALRPDQRAYADHLLRSWGNHVEFFTGKPIQANENVHVPVVRHAINVTLCRRP